eukprot:1793151-Prymnesium_polylepis.3
MCAHSRAPFGHRARQDADALPMLEMLLPHLTDDDISARPSGWYSDADDCRSGGRTALQMALVDGAVDCVRVLLRLGASASL